MNLISRGFNKGVAVAIKSSGILTNAVLVNKVD